MKKIDNVYFSDYISTSDLKQHHGQRMLLIANPADFNKCMNALDFIRDRVGNILFEEVDPVDYLQHAGDVHCESST